MSMRLEHVNMTVADLDRSVTFYCDLLDLHVRWKGEIAPGRLGAHVGDDDHYLALFQAGSGSARPSPDYTGPGINHFGFVVDDLDEVKARLDRLGGRVHHEAAYDPGSRIYTTDPDGNELELVEY